MTSEFDKDEINDSSFPIDFNDDSASLDMFGVWVKSGPRSATSSPATSVSASSVERDFLDLSDLPELPDFGEPVPDEAEQTDALIVEPEQMPDFDSFPDSIALAETDAETVIESAQDDVMEINLDEFLGSETALSEPAPVEESFLEDTSKPVEETAIPEEIIDFGVAEETVGPDEMEITFDTADEMGIPSSLDEFESLKESVDEADFSLPANDNLPSDDDFSNFLDDLNSGSISDSASEPKPASITASVADDLDLDSFINSVNETGSSSHEDSVKVFSDTEPVDIELEFDESYIEDVQKIKAAGAASSDSEFFNQEFGVELIDETGGSAETFKDMTFESIPDISAMDTAKPSVASASSTTGIETTNEFDDLLSSLDLSPTPAMAVKSESKQAAQAKKTQFDLAVTDEGDESVTGNVTETASDEDIEVSLTGVQVAKPAEPSPAKIETPPTSSLSVEEELADFFEKEAVPSDSTFEIAPEEVATEEVAPEEVVPNIEDNLDIPDIRDYNETNSGENWVVPEVVTGEEEVSLDFDDISALEKDLNDANLEPGETQLTANDKSTELLMKIADELSSIKLELSTLKTELANVKPFSGDKIEPSVADDQNSDNSGFFTDDDTDETIALTGDELNNILITADFTEEKSADAEIAAESGIATVAGISANTEISADTEIPESDILASLSMEPTIDEELEIPDVLPETAIDAVPIESPLPGVEVAHVTTLPEDTSYLEGSDTVETDFDNVAIEEPELEIIDFDDEKLEEPELAEFNLDLTDIEASLPAEQEVAVDIPLMDQVVEALPTEDLLVEPLPKIEAIPDIEASTGVTTLPVELKDEIKSVLSYMDQLLESLPEDKIEEFARSEHFEVYKKLFEELGIS